MRPGRIYIKTMNKFKKMFPQMFTIFLMAKRDEPQKDGIIFELMNRANKMIWNSLAQFGPDKQKSLYYDKYKIMHEEQIQHLLNALVEISGEKCDRYGKLLEQLQQTEDTKA